MKRFFVLILLLSVLFTSIQLSSCGDSSGESTDMPSENVDGGSGEQNTSGDGTTVYKSLLQSATHYDDFNVLTSRDEYEYDNDDRVIRLSVTGRDGKLISDTVTQYDDAGRISVKKTFDGTGNITEWVEYVYDEYGKLQKEHRYTSKGQLQYILTYSFDVNGRKAGNTMRDGFGKLYYQVTTTYDEKGDYVSILNHVNGTSKRAECSAADVIFKEIDYDADGNVVSSKEYEYDAVTNLRTRTITVDSNGLHTELDYFYNENGNVDHITYTHLNGEIAYIRRYTYDAYDNVISDRIENPIGVPTESAKMEYVIFKDSESIKR